MRYIYCLFFLLFCSTCSAFDLVVDGGADPTFTKDSTAAFLKAAKFTKDNAIGIVTPKGVIGASPSVNIPLGRYKISDEIIGWGHTTIIGNNAVIKQTDNTKRIFVFDKSSRINIQSVQFLSGVTAVAITNPNINASQFIIEKCQFRESLGYAISTFEHLSATLVIRDCEFYECNGCYNNTCDLAKLDNCWFDGFTGPYCINNIRGKLSIQNTILVPTHNTSGHYWISNYGDLFCTECRFSGEGGGLPVLKHSSSSGQVYPFMGNMVVFSKCQLSAGPVSMVDSAIVTLENGLPQLLKFSDCHYMVGVPIIDSIGDLSVVLSGVTKKELLRITFEDCVSWPVVSTTNNPRIDSRLLQYIRIR